MSEEGNYKNSKRAGNILLVCGVIGIVITLIAGGVLLIVLARINDLENQADYYENNPLERASYALENGYDPVDVFRKEAQESRSAILPLMAVTFLMFIASVVIFIGGFQSKKQKSYVFVLFSSIMSFFILGVLFVIPTYFVIKAKDEFSATDKIQQIDRYQSPQPAYQVRTDVQPNIPPITETADKLNLLMMSNLSKEEKEKQLLKLYLDDKITKEQFYDVKRKL